ncbi:hypothetical protein FACS189468_0090 [Spirochaetia bacterium]|nr:hypothetical protein FACS189468_0090 [Spirochaetia bacterium]
MEKKKLLLVAVSVGVFLVIVVGAAILVFTPGAASSADPVITERTLAPASPPPGQAATVDPADLVRSNELQGLQVPPSATAIQENNIYINGETEALTMDRSTGDGSTRTVINIPRPSVAVASGAAPAEPRKAPPQPAPAPAPQPAAKKAAPQPRPAPAAVKPAASAAPPAKQVPVKTAKDFWVQTGSYSTRTGADGVKETLSSKGIGAIIVNRELNGKTYYRVRVGPYTSQNEADYWLALIKAINGFEDSQIWESQSQR